MIDRVAQKINHNYKGQEAIYFKKNSNAIYLHEFVEEDIIKKYRFKKNQNHQIS